MWSPKAVLVLPFSRARKPRHQLRTALQVGLVLPHAPKITLGMRQMG